MKNRQNVMIKGTKNGLTLQFSDTCSYGELLKELDEKLAELQGVDLENTPLVSVRILTGNRLLTSEQQEEIKEKIRSVSNLVVEEVESFVVAKEEAQRMIREHARLRAAAAWAWRR